MKPTTHDLALAAALVLCACKSAPQPDLDSPAPQAAAPEEAPAHQEGPATPNETTAPAVTATAFDSLWNYQDPAGTRRSFETLLDEQAGEWTLDLRLQLMTQIARTFSLASEFEDCHAVLDEVQGQLPAGPSVARIRYNLERGRCFRSNSQGELARPHFLAAWEASQSSGESYYAVDAAHMLGILEEGQASLDWNHKAMEAAERSDDPRAKGWLGALYNNTGWTHHDNGDFEAAMELWIKAEGWHKEFGSTRTHRIALWTIARCERSMGHHARALELQEKLLALDVPQSESGYTHEEIGENLWALGRQDEARSHFEMAYEVLSADKWLQSNQAERLARLSRLAAGADE